MFSFWPSFGLLIFTLAIFLEGRALGGRATLPLRGFLAFFAYGCIGAPLFSLLLEQIPFFQFEAVDNARFDLVLPAAWWIGPPAEELAKAAPVILLAFVLKTWRRLSIADLTLIGFASGLGFGFVENNLHVLVNGSSLDFRHLLGFGFVTVEDSTGGYIFGFAGHAVYPALFGLAAGIGLRFYPVRRAYAWLPAAAVFLIACFDHGMFNWKMSHPGVDAGSFEAAAWPVEMLYLLTIHGLLETWLLPAGLIAAQFAEAVLCTKVSGRRSDLLLPREYRPWAVNEWLVALVRLPLGRSTVERTLAYFRRRRAYAIAKLETTRDPGDRALAQHVMVLDQRLRRECEILLTPTRSAWLPRTSPAEVLRAWVSRLRWGWAFAVLFIPLFLIGPSQFTPWMKGVLHGPVFAAIVITFGLGLAAWHGFLHLRLPRLDPVACEGTGFAINHARIFLLGSALAAAAVPVFSFLLGWTVPAPEAAYISSYISGWVAQGGNLYALLGLGALGGAAFIGGDGMPSTNPLRGEIAQGRERLRALDDEIEQFAVHGSSAVTQNPFDGRLDALSTLLARRDEEREEQAWRELALDEYERQTAEARPGDLNLAVRNMKTTFERLECEFLAAAAGEIERIASFEKTYNGVWTQIMQNLDSYENSHRNLNLYSRDFRQPHRDASPAPRFAKDAEDARPTPEALLSALAAIQDMTARDAAAPDVQAEPEHGIAEEFVAATQDGGADERIETLSSGEMPEAGSHADEVVADVAHPEIALADLSFEDSGALLAAAVPVEAVDENLPVLAAPALQDAPIPEPAPEPIPLELPIIAEDPSFIEQQPVVAEREPDVRKVEPDIAAFEHIPIAIPDVALENTVYVPSADLVGISGIAASFVDIALFAEPATLAKADVAPAEQESEEEPDAAKADEPWAHAVNSPPVLFDLPFVVEAVDTIGPNPPFAKPAIPARLMFAASARLAMANIEAAMAKHALLQSQSDLPPLPVHDEDPAELPEDDAVPAETEIEQKHAEPETAKTNEPWAHAVNSPPVLFDLPLFAEAEGMLAPNLPLAEPAMPVRPMFAASARLAMANIEAAVVKHALLQSQSGILPLPAHGGNWGLTEDAEEVAWNADGSIGGRDQKSTPVAPHESPDSHDTVPVHAESADHLQARGAQYQEAQRRLGSTGETHLETIADGDFVEFLRTFQPPPVIAAPAAIPPQQELPPDAVEEDMPAADALEAHDGLVEVLETFTEVSRAVFEEEFEDDAVEAAPPAIVLAADIAPIVKENATEAEAMVETAPKQDVTADALLSALQTIAEESPSRGWAKRLHAWTRQFIDPAEEQNQAGRVAEPPSVSAPVVPAANDAAGIPDAQAATPESAPVETAVLSVSAPVLPKPEESAEVDGPASVRREMPQALPPVPSEPSDAVAAAARRKTEPVPANSEDREAAAANDAFDPMSVLRETTESLIKLLAADEARAVEAAEDAAPAKPAVRASAAPVMQAEVHDEDAIAIALRELKKSREENARRAAAKKRAQEIADAETALSSEAEVLPRAASDHAGSVRVVGRGKTIRQDTGRKTPPTPPLPDYNSRRPAKFFNPGAEPRQDAGNAEGDKSARSAPSAPARDSGSKLSAALADYYAKSGEQQPPMHATDAESFKKIVASGKLETPRRGPAPWSFSGLPRKGDYVIKLKSGSEKHVEFTPSTVSFGQSPRFYPRTVGVGHYENSIPIEHLEYFDPGMRQWLPVNRKGTR